MPTLNYYAKKLPDGKTELMRFADGRPIPRPFQRQDVPQAGGGNFLTKLMNKGAVEVTRATYHSNLGAAKYITYSPNGEPKLVPCNYSYDEIHGRAVVSQAVLATMFPNANLAGIPAGACLQAKLSEALENNRNLFLYDGDNSLDGINKIGGGLAIARILGTAAAEAIVVEAHDFEAEYANALAAFQSRQKEGSEKSASAAITAAAPAPSKRDHKSELEHHAITVLTAAANDGLNTEAASPAAGSIKPPVQASAKVLSFQPMAATAAASGSTPIATAAPVDTATAPAPTTGDAASAPDQFHLVVKLKSSGSPTK